jgi:hypothetical protein
MGGPKGTKATMEVGAKKAKYSRHNVHDMEHVIVFTKENPAIAIDWY